MALLVACTTARADDFPEFGISFTLTGVVDHRSGLEWLDAGLTEGNIDDLQFWLDAGWRIASQEEFFFLVTRVPGMQFGGSETSDLGVDQLDGLKARLSFESAWVCSAFQDPATECVSTESFGGPFGLGYEPTFFGDGSVVWMSVVLTELPMYTDLDCLKFPPCARMGKSLMVRYTDTPVPDTDGDGFNDLNDNCLLHANPAQRDTNGDGIGNRCDPDLTLLDCRVDFGDLFRFRPLMFSTDDDADLDGDGFVNFADLSVVFDFFFGEPGPSGLADDCDCSQGACDFP